MATTATKGTGFVQVKQFGCIKEVYYKYPQETQYNLTVVDVQHRRYAKVLNELYKGCKKEKLQVGKKDMQKLYMFDALPINCADEVYAVYVQTPKGLLLVEVVQGHTIGGKPKAIYTPTALVDETLETHISGYACYNLIDVAHIIKTMLSVDASGMLSDDWVSEATV